MARALQDIIITSYNGPQGSVQLETGQSATINRSKERRKAHTMRPGRIPIGFQSGPQDVTINVTVIPELVDYEVDWVKAWLDDEVFGLSYELGEGGLTEEAPTCMVADANNSADQDGNATLELTISVLNVTPIPAAA